MKRCSWCGGFILPFQKKVDEMHYKCKKERDEYLEQKEEYRCWSGHSFLVKRKDAFDRCPICGRQVVPAWWFNSTRACVNVVSLGESAESELKLKRLPYLPDAFLIENPKLFK